MTPELRDLFVDDAPAGWLAMLEATLAFGVSRQTIMQRVKRRYATKWGERPRIDAVR